MTKAIAHRILYALMALSLVSVLLLAGCAEVRALRAAVAKHGADAADQTVATAVWTLCNGSPVGAIKRWFDTPEEQAAYNVMCPGSTLPTGSQE